jgi:transcriptional regulator with XRE-family HTH domain
MTTTLRSLRLDNGLSQAQLALLIDVEACTISFWETRTKTIRPRNAWKLCRFFRVSRRQLLDDEGYAREE